MHINDLPAEVLRYILSHLSPYGDLPNCKLVCKYWYESVAATLDAQATKFRASLRTANVQWFYYNPQEAPRISARYSHSCCLHSNLMYIFGGCTAGKTTFNDLWTFDLFSRQWIRPLASGSYPPPKACCSMIPYHKQLILFGGWTHASANRIHDSWKLFNHVHTFDTETKKWTLLETRNTCPPTSGHSASIHRDQMIVFGGLRSIENAPYQYSPSNEVWVLDLLSNQWRKQETSSPTPEARYGHSQMVIDDHVIILGGCGGPNNILNDMWMLNLQGDVWQWSPINIECDSSEFPGLGFNPVCKVDQMLVLLGKVPGSRTSPTLSSSHYLRMVSQRSQENLSSSLSSSSSSKNLNQPSTSSSSSSASNPCSGPSNSGAVGGRKLEPNILSPTCSTNNPNLNRHLARPNHLVIRESLPLSSMPKVEANRVMRKFVCSSYSNETLSLYTIDISQMITDKKVKYVPQGRHVPGPNELMLYSLIKGNSELIMFGGIHKDNVPVNGLHISDTVYILTSKRAVI